MKLLKLSIIALTAFLAVGCASTSDIENLQGQINTLKTDITGAKDAAASANTAAADAAARATAAEAAANRAANTAQEVNTKLDRMFKSSMMK
jgi:murein lipoprotein